MLNTFTVRIGFGIAFGLISVGHIPRLVHPARLNTVLYIYYVAIVAFGDIPIVYCA